MADVVTTFVSQNHVIVSETEPSNGTVGTSKTIQFWFDDDVAAIHQDGQQDSIPDAQLVSTVTSLDESKGIDPFASGDIMTVDQAAGQQAQSLLNQEGPVRLRGTEK